jgi:hypothetical protein
MYDSEKGSAMRQHPLEDMIRASIAAVMQVTGENLTDLGNRVGLSKVLVSRRQRGDAPWRVADLGYLADHWGIPPCSLISGPSDAIAELSPKRIADLRRAKGLPPAAASAPAVSTAA